MRYATSSVGTSRVVFETTSEPVTGAPGESIAAPDEGHLEDAYDELKSLLLNITSDLGTALREQASAGLSKVSVAIALTLGGEADVWVVKATGQGSVTATLEWDFGAPQA